MGFQGNYSIIVHSCTCMCVCIICMCGACVNPFILSSRMCPHVAMQYAAQLKSINLCI